MSMKKFDRGLFEMIYDYWLPPNCDNEACEFHTGCWDLDENMDSAVVYFMKCGHKFCIKHSGTVDHHVADRKAANPSYIRI